MTSLIAILIWGAIGIGFAWIAGYFVLLFADFVTLLKHSNLIGVRLVATLADLQTSITDNTAAVNALTAAAGTITPPHDFQPEVDAIAANTTAVNAVTAQLGATGP